MRYLTRIHAAFLTNVALLSSSTDEPGETAMATHYRNCGTKCQNN
jgi:hypothetical protein